MGSSQSNENHQHQHHDDKHHLQHKHQKHRSSFSVGEKLNPVTEDFLKWLASQNDNSAKFILNYFSNSNIIRLIFTDLNQDEIDTASAIESKIDVSYLKSFINQLANAYSSASVAQVYIDFLYGDEQYLELTCIYQIFQDCLFFAIKLLNADHNCSFYAKQTLNSIINSITNQANNYVPTNNEDNVKIQVSKADLQSWILTEFAELFYGFHNYLLNRVKKLKIETDESAAQKTVIADLSDFMNTTTNWFLLCSLPTAYLKNFEVENASLVEKFRNGLLHKKWSLLYTSDSNGLSLNRFTNHLFNYKAPTVLFVYCKNGSCYCICTTKEYKEAPTPYGDEQTRIYQLWPKFKNYELKDPTKSIYLNTRSRVLRLGLIFGDNEKKPIIRINEDFQHVDHESKLSDTLISIEVWGCGHAKELESQKNLKDWEKKQIEKMRTVKLNADWSGNADKTILDLAGIQTDHAQRGDI